MRIKMFSAMHGRHDVVRIFFEGYKRLYKDFDISLHLTVSTDIDALFCKGLGVEYNMYPNMPLSDKHNSGISECLSDQSWEYLLIMGSDNVITTKGLELLLSSGRRHVGFSGGMFFDLATQRAKVFDYNIELGWDSVWGCGRLLSRELVEYVFDTQEVLTNIGDGDYPRRHKMVVPVEEANYLVATKRWERRGGMVKGLWPSGLSKGLDMGLERKLIRHGAAPFSIGGVHCFDFKSGDNLWKYDDREGSSCGHEFLFRQFLSESEIKLINKMKK